MANLKHMDIIKRGVDSWNTWRAKNSHILPSLSDAGLHMAFLNKANLAKADLSDAGLRLAELIEADLKGANLYWANLSEANLKRANLSLTDLQRANMACVNLQDAKLTGANLKQANMSRANLKGAQLIRADLSGVDLKGADLRDANLRETYLVGANLTDVNLEGADLTNATIGGTIFGNVNISNVKGLETLMHLGPSTVGVDSIFKSRGCIPIDFLRNAGVPPHLIDYIEMFVDRHEYYYSCIISYCAGDKILAYKLHAELQSLGVQCWLPNEKMKRRDRSNMIFNSSVEIHDKVIFVLSEEILKQEWAENVIEAALAKEKKCGMTILLPIALDDSYKFTDIPWAVKLRRTHHIFDFTMWRDEGGFQESMSLMTRQLNDDYQEPDRDEYDSKEEYGRIKPDRAAAVVNQMIAWNNIRHARLS